MNYKHILSLFILLITTQSAFSQKTAISGQPISATEMNASLAQIGSIQHSILDEAKFQSLSGSCWVLMDGRAIPGTDLANLTSMTNVPDARGTFLRMANNGRSDGQQNPTNTELGEYQSDELKSHTHSYETSRPPDVPGRESSYIGYGQNNSRSNQSGKILAAGGPETRPKSITVNFFIKVNKVCL